MRIYDVSCNTYLNKRSNPTFGFWQPAMAAVEKYPESITRVSHYIAERIPKDGIWLKGKLNKTLDTVGLDMYKKRHVNIKGSREKIERVTFNRYSWDGVTQRYQQDLYPDGSLITTVKDICSKGVKKIEEFIENIR